MRGVFFLMMVLGVLGCGPSSPSSSSDSASEPVANMISQTIAPIVGGEAVAKVFNPFWVYKDKGIRENHFVPSGFMPNGKCLKFDDAWKQDCQGEGGKTCIKIVYDVECSREDQNWAGIYWLNPANNWGKQKGGFNLNGAQELSFWAKGENGGERIEEFKTGGINGDYPDTDMAMIGPVILTNEWREYTIDLRGKDLSYISGGFSWSTNVDVNPDGCTFYLDNIQYR